MIDCKKCVHYPVCFVFDDICEEFEECIYYEEKRPHGEWIFHRYDHDFECSNCHVRFDEDEFSIEIPDRGNVWHKVHRYKYCPLCGSDNQKDDWAKEGDE